MLGLRKLRDVPAGILERDELVPARQRDWISEATFPREWPNSASTQFFTLSREPDSNSTPGHWVIYGSSNGFKGDPMGRKKRSASWHDQAEALKAEAEKLPYGHEREELERKARQLEIASNINQWVSSPGLAPPR